MDTKPPAQLLRLPAKWSQNPLPPDTQQEPMCQPPPVGRHSVTSCPALPTWHLTPPPTHCTPALPLHRRPGTNLTRHCPADVPHCPEVFAGGKRPAAHQGFKATTLPTSSLTQLVVCGGSLEPFHPPDPQPHCSLCQEHQSHGLKDCPPEAFPWPSP